MRGCVLFFIPENLISSWKSVKWAQRKRQVQYFMENKKDVYGCWCWRWKIGLANLYKGRCIIGLLIIVGSFYILPSTINLARAIFSLLSLTSWQKIHVWVGLNLACVSLQCFMWVTMNQTCIEINFKVISAKKCFGMVEKFNQ